MALLMPLTQALLVPLLLPRGANRGCLICCKEKNSSPNCNLFFLQKKAKHPGVQRSPGKKPRTKKILFFSGTEGFEPTNIGTKNRCLTTWRRPKIHPRIYSKKRNSMLLPKGSDMIFFFSKSKIWACL